MIWARLKSYFEASLAGLTQPIRSDWIFALRTEFTGRGKVEIGRFKGLGDMMAAQLKETTMDPRKRTLLRVDVIDAVAATKEAVDALMGTKPEARFRFIQERAEFAATEVLDI